MTAIDDRPPGEVADSAPQDLAAEQAVLGAMMLSRGVVPDVAGIVKPEDFYLPAHETVFRAILDLEAAGSPTDTIAVSDELDKRQSLASVGGRLYVFTLFESCLTASNATYYAGIVAEHASNRRLIAAGTRMVQLGRGAEGGDADAILGAAQAELTAVVEARARVSEWTRAGEAVAAALEEIDNAAGRELMGVPTGLVDLDRLMHGLHPGQMVIVAARPAVGKSTLALDFARHASVRCGLPAAIFSLEMSSLEISQRLLSAEARVHLTKIRSGTVDADDWQRISRVTGVIDAAPLLIDDSATTNMRQIRAKCRAMKQREGLALVVVDYLQLMTSGRKVESRQQEVSEFSRALKLLAKELEVPVIAVAQLNRGPELRQDKKPMLADLRESGSLEQDSDVVILIHREDIYEKESPRAGEADLIVAKHRNGATATVTVAFQGHYSRFVDMADTPVPPPRHPNPYGLRAVN